MKEPIERIREAMRANGVSALLVSEISNVQWATGFSGSSGWVLLTPSRALFLTDSRYTIQAQAEVSVAEVRSFANPVTATQFLAAQVSELELKELAFEAESVAYATFEEWSQALAPTRLVPIKGLLAPLRMVKGPEEIAAVHRACELADQCFESILPQIRPGVTEAEIGLEIEFFIRRKGAQLAFEPAVVSGHRSAMPHGRPSSKAIADGDFLTLDFGAKLDGYCSDVTRTLVVGRASERQRQVYDAVLHAQQAAIEAMRPGVQARNVDAVARAALAERGLSDYFGHGLGHGLGRTVHDFGRMSPSSSDVLEVGQVWTVEPGVYIDGFGGVRIEDDVVVTESGVDVLNRSPKHLIELSEAHA